MSDKPSDDEISRARGFGPPVPREPASWATEAVLEMARRDYADKLATAEKKGKAEGVAEGVAIGVAEGVAIGEANGKLQERRAVVKNMLLQKFSVENISKITGYPVGEVVRLSSDS